MAPGKGNEPVPSDRWSEHIISTKILDAGANEERTWAHVIGYIGPEDHPRGWVEDVVSIVYQFKLDLLRVEAAQAGCPCKISWPPGGMPSLRLLEPRDEEHVLAKLAELKQVAPKAVVDEAKARVLGKLLGIPWEDPQEIALTRRIERDLTE
jgi:hypothetical protein